MSGNEQYYVRYSIDPFPVEYSGKYTLVKSVFKRTITAVSYEIYKRN
jgi:hypothetical protein